MEMTQHLVSNLKRLRMPAAVDNLELRQREAEERQLGYLEFLSLVVQDEVTSRESNNLAGRLKNARLDPRLTFETFNFRYNAETIPSQTVRDLAAYQFAKQNTNLVFCGPPGIGKTHIAQAIAHENCRRGEEALFAKTHKILEELADPLNPKRVNRLWKRLIAVPLLILDDFGFRRYEAKEAEHLYAISDERLGKGSTILTSNRPPDDWFAVFPDPVVGGAVLDRFVSGAIKIIIEEGNSYRKINPGLKKDFPENPL